MVSRLHQWLQEIVSSATFHGHVSWEGHIQQVEVLFHISAIIRQDKELDWTAAYHNLVFLISLPEDWPLLWLLYIRELAKCLFNVVCHVEVADALTILPQNSVL